MIFAISGTDLDADDEIWVGRVAARWSARPAPGTWLAHGGEPGVTVHETAQLIVVAEAKMQGSQGPSHAEAIAQQYEQRDLDLMPHLRGALAFVLYDLPRRRLLATSTLTSRRPLALWSDGRRTLVTSRLLPLLRHPRVPGTIDQRYLASTILSSVGILPGSTAIAGIRRLCAGEAILTSASGKRMVTIDRLRPRRSSWRTFDPQTIWGSLDESVRESLQLASAPCIALSGGLDSAAVAATARVHRSLPAFSMLAPSYTAHGQSIDESAAVAALEQAWPGLRVERVDCSTCNAYPELGNFDLRDDPPLTPLSLVSSRLQTWKAMATAGFTSVFDGEGGDELFSAYVTPLDALRSGHWLSLLRHLRSQSGRRLLVERGLILPLLPRFAREAWMRRGARSGSILPSYLAPAALSRAELVEACEAHFALLAHRPALERFAHWLSSPWNVGSAMAHEMLAARFGLTLVSPMMDRGFVEWVLGAPAGSMLPHGEDKRILRLLLIDRVPESVRRLPKDTRFPEKLLIDIVCSAPVREALADKRVTARLADWIRVAKLEALLAAVRGGYRPHRWLMWQLESIVSFAEWYSRATREYGVD